MQQSRIHSRALIGCGSGGFVGANDSTCASARRRLCGWPIASGAGYETKVNEPVGVSASFLGGIAGIVLGILALLGIAAPMLAVAVIVFGASCLVGFNGGSGTTEASVAAFGGQTMVGLSAIVLGILAVVGASQWTLVLVGLLCLGVFALFSGSSIGARSVSAVTR